MDRSKAIELLKQEKVVQSQFVNMSKMLGMSKEYVDKGRATIKALDLAIEALERECDGDCIEVAAIRGMPPVNQKQITGKLESVENATSEGEESTMNQPKSKLDCISRQQAIEAIEREIDKDYDRNDITDRYYRMTLRLARNIIQDLPSLPPSEPEYKVNPELKADLLKRLYEQTHDELMKVKSEHKTGEWKKRATWEYCSECGWTIHEVDDRTYNYCPNCGAKMGERREE